MILTYSHFNHFKQCSLEYVSQDSTHNKYKNSIFKKIKYEEKEKNYYNNSNKDLSSLITRCFN